MILLDKEPRANIVATRALPEGLSSSIIQPQIPDVFHKAFEGEALDVLHPVKTITAPIGRNRFSSELSLGFRKKGKESLDRLKRGGRSRRCGNCRGRHSPYGKCQDGGLLRLNQFKLISISSGFN